MDRRNFIKAAVVAPVAMLPSVEVKPEPGSWGWKYDVCEATGLPTNRKQRYFNCYRRMLENATENFMMSIMANLIASKMRAFLWGEPLGIKNTLIFGDSFFRRTPHGIVDMETSSMYRIETVAGKLIEYQFSLEGPDYQAMAENTKSEYSIRFKPEEIIHIRMPIRGDKKKFYPYGESQIEEILKHIEVPSETLVRTPAIDALVYEYAEVIYDQWVL